MELSQWYRFIVIMSGGLFTRCTFISQLRLFMAWFGADGPNDVDLVYSGPPNCIRE
jgi:hypothetical protein